MISQLQFSEVLVKWRRFFHQMAAEQGKAGLAALETKLEVKKLQVSFWLLKLLMKTSLFYSGYAPFLGWVVWGNFASHISLRSCDIFLGPWKKPLVSGLMTLSVVQLPIKPFLFCCPFSSYAQIYLAQG